MTRHQKDPLRPLAPEERAALEQLGRAQREPASHVVRARLVLAVAAGQSYTAAARGVGRRSGDAVAHLVARFNREGLAAIVPGHGGGAAVVYKEGERARILAEARRAPDRDEDGTATWSLSTLRRALRAAPDGLPGVSEYTIWAVLRGAGRRWQRDRSWCETGVVVRRRKAGAAVVTDPDAAPKKLGWQTRPAKGRFEGGKVGVRVLTEAALGAAGVLAGAELLAERAPRGQIGRAERHVVEDVAARRHRRDDAHRPAHDEPRRGHCQLEPSRKRGAGCAILGA